MHAIDGGLSDGEPLHELAVLADLPELVDLRLHRPRSDVVIVRVSGSVDRLTARLWAGLVGKRLDRARHVVLDLSDVSVLDPRGARGKLHIGGASRDADGVVILDTVINDDFARSRADALDAEAAY